MAAYTACLPPLVMTTWLGATSTPEYWRALAATASRNSGKPAAAV